MSVAVVGRDAVTAVILAGGRARRLGGVHKPLLELGGETILSRELAVLSPRASRVLLSTNDSALGDLGVDTVADATPGQGPLGGIAAAMRAATTPWLLVVAGDLPLLSGAVLELLLARAGEEVDAVAPFVGDWPEPLCALYATGALVELDRRLAAGQLKVARLLTDGALRVARVGEAELRTVDPELASLLNVNESADLARAQELLKVNG